MKKRCFALLCAMLLLLSLTACAKKQTCTITVRCDNALASADLSADKAAALPADGQIIATETVTLKDGMTVLDVLRTAAEQHAVALDVIEGDYVYVSAIAGLAGLDAGDLSGWMVSVNGEFPSESAAAITAQSGDEIAFLYTCDMGADLGLTWD